MYAEPKGSVLQSEVAPADLPGLAPIEPLQHCALQRRGAGELSQPIEFSCAENEVERVGVSVSAITESSKPTDEGTDVAVGDTLSRR